MCRHVLETERLRLLRLVTITQSILFDWHGQQVSRWCYEAVLLTRELEFECWQKHVPLRDVTQTRKRGILLSINRLVGEKGYP